MALQDGNVSDAVGAGGQESRAGFARAPVSGDAVRGRLLDEEQPVPGDPVGAARGLLLGLALGVLLWAAIIAVAWRLLNA